MDVVYVYSWLACLLLFGEKMGNGKWESGLGGVENAEGLCIWYSKELHKCNLFA